MASADSKAATCLIQEVDQPVCPLHGVHSKPVTGPLNSLVKPVTGALKP